jgi:hypothetical protein
MEQYDLLSEYLTKFTEKTQEKSFDINLKLYSLKAGLYFAN